MITSPDRRDTAAEVVLTEVIQISQLIWDRTYKFIFTQLEYFQICKTKEPFWHLAIKVVAV